MCHRFRPQNRSDPHEAFGLFIVYTYKWFVSRIRDFFRIL